ncbi:MAG: succinate dehydrogenase, hydrophobic membrane anchor protein [bacterium]|nr:succinate dehydrogenase, hydrophobic membrane anchor protein [bacterium]
MFRLIKNLTKDTLLNPHTGMGSFWLQRITGVLLALYIFPHIVIISTAALYGGPMFTKLIGAMNTPVVWVFELAMIFGVAFHLLNGLRIILVDFFPLSRKQQQLLWLVSVGCLVIIAFSIVAYAPKFIHFLEGHTL